MKESHVEGLASHGDPESCASNREGAGEALTGAHTGRVLSRENKLSQGADAVSGSGRPYAYRRHGKSMRDPARSKTSGTCGNSMHENREIPDLPSENGQGDALERSMTVTQRCTALGSRTVQILPMKRLNKPDSHGAEAVEERGLAKENTDQQNTSRTQCRNNDVPSALDRVRQAARRSRDERFSALFHHITLDRLEAAFFAIKKNAAAGVDGVTWEQYEQDLGENLRALYDRLHRGAYRAKPSRRVFIPKADGQMRPLGIAALEDKIVQRVVAELLNAIYEVDFLGFSYGFRPGRQAHLALDALAVGIRRKKISWVLDADVRNFFGSISHKWMMEFLQHRIADRRILRLIRKWLKAGVMENEKWTASEEGSPQGASISPLLANVYLHYALDLWVQQWRTRYARGDVIIVRWADDFVVGFQYEAEGRDFQQQLCARLGKFGLQLHPEKTRLIRFGRFAKRDAKRLDGQRKPSTFSFLGFTHFCGVNRNGKFQVERRTMSKRLTVKLNSVKAQLRKRMHHDLVEQGRWLQAVVRGYFGYHAIPGNWNALGTFRTQIARLWYRSLRRRSQKRTLTWSRMNVITARWLPPARILHPYPEQRLYAIIRGRSPVR